MSIAYIGLGSNLGDREKNLQNAITRIRGKEGIRIIRISSFYESDPWGVKEQPRFLNCVVEVETSLEPRSLLQSLLSIEGEMGRRRGRRWGPRLIDIDLLLYDSVVIHDESPEGLILPHPEMHRRKFVLLPLLELIPDAIHPKIKKPLKSFLNLQRKDKTHDRMEIYLR